MRIQSDQKIGIGVNDPDADLDISGGSNKLGILRVTQRASGAAAYGLDIGLDSTTGDPVFSRIVNDTVTEAIRIQRSSGKVGIGTASPSSRLYLQDEHTTTATNAATLIANATLSINGNSGQGSDLIRMGPMCSSGAYFIDVSNSGGSAAYPLVLNPFSGGNVGIGTAAPLRQLSIANTASAEMSFISGTSSNASILFGDGLTGTDVYRGYIQYEHANDAMLFATSATERFRIASNGDLTATDTSIASNSDERLKENIADYSYDIAKFKQYEPKTFDWKNPEAHNGRSGNRGFIAQAVKAIDDKWVGEANVTEENPDYDIISDNVSLTSKLGDKDAMYISVIQQLIAKIEVLETKVAALEGE